ncbi:SDR family NAD(P)-dependent oxidoreductase [Rickettsiales bacterium]|nr:SDR family NAD(P)-dependent oxidoreductase [Rickettsiales bacterium]MDA7705354.1 SDR family NAD(P)-dependent oxidoreductase [Rickettsiales bacterium]MDB2550389.1 SDR family NAD(P)-dependent oxidoreductase [Rickettsiales bacterium]
MDNYKTILITGANSGIGFALAKEYANRGVKLFLIARNLDRLKKIAKICQKKGAKTEIFAVDVREKEQISQFFDKISKKDNIDLVIANAGISANKISDIEKEDQIEELIDINIKGVLNFIIPAQRIMMKQKYGQIALMSSLASFKAVAGSESYSASKAYIRIFGEGLRLKLAKFNIKVNIICPGYIKTPLTDLNDFPMPFLMNPYKAAKIIRKGLDKNKSRIAFPWPLYKLILLITSLPIKLSDYIFSNLPKYSKKEQ